MYNKDYYQGYALCATFTETPDELTEHSSFVQVYYKEAVGAFVVFDVTRVSTFEAVTKWKSDIDSKVNIPGTDNPIPVVLLANKVR
jgi:GTPase SAR1 family protein